MPIELGLKRVGKLAALLGNPQTCFNSVHIAGTNGKGSICSYISSVLTASKIRNGKFTSPHLIRRSDCITIDNSPISHAEFLDEENRVKEVNLKYDLHCTEFEILTCTAFEIFKKQQVEVAVVEVGLGGRLDATNIIPPASKSSKGVIVTGISKIGLDHEGILGSTLKQISFEKAGIMKDDVPCVADGTNDPECIQVLKEVSTGKSSPLHVISDPKTTRTKFGSISDLNIPLLGNYQFSNLTVSLQILELISTLYPAVNSKTVAEGVSKVQWPGRLQRINLQYNSSRPAIDVLIDGAHNGSAAIELNKYIESNLRKEGKAITFVMAVTEGKSLDPLLSPLIKRHDNVVLTTFSEVDGMPWISCSDPLDLQKLVGNFTPNISVRKKLTDALELASQLGDDVVICGSLYLVADVLRLKLNDLGN